MLPNEINKVAPRIPVPEVAAAPVQQTPQPEQPTSNARPLTEEDIAGSKTLRSKGIKPGDMFDPTTNEITRVTSTAPRGQIITEEDVARSKTLRDKGVEAGDILMPQEDGSFKHVKSGDNDWVANLNYWMNTSDEATEDWGNWLDAHIPLPRIDISMSGIDIITPSEYYGEDYKDLTPEQRIQRGIEYKLEALDAMKENFEPGEGISKVAGQILGEVDPSWLVGSRLLTAAAVGGATAVGEDLAKGKEVDAKKAAMYAAGAGAVVGATNKVLQLVQKSKAAKAEKASVVAKRAVLETAINQNLQAGKPLNKAIKEAEVATDLKVKDLNVTVKVSSPTATATAKAADEGRAAVEAVDRQIVTNSTSARVKYKAVDKILGVLSTRIRNIDEDLFFGLRKFEKNSHVKTASKLKKVNPFVEGMKKIPSASRQGVNQALLNGNFEVAEEAFKQFAPEFVGSTKAVKEVLESSKIELQNAGFKFEGIDQYFPRAVDDLDAFSKTTKGEGLKGNIQFAQDSLRAKKGRELTIEERDNITEKVLNGLVYNKAQNTWTRPKKQSFQQQRTVDEVTSDMVDLYVNPTESLVRYIQRSTNAVERAKFFGKGNKVDADGFNGTESVNSLVSQVVAKKGLSQEQETALAEMLQARFIGGEQGMGTVGAVLRDTGYMGTIANPLSALQQVTDMANAMMLYGFRNTILSAIGRKNHKMVDLGIEMASEEFNNRGKVAKALDKMFTVSGFKLIDRLGKETLIESAMRSYAKKAKTPKGLAEFKKEYGAMFGDEFDNLVADLSTGKRTDLTDLLAFNVLSDMQPITRSEFPEAYLRSGSVGKLAYMLKSFTIKQYDVVRNKILRDAKSNPAEAAKKMALLMAYLTASNTGIGMVRDIAQGRKVDPGEVPDRALWALLGVYGANKYSSERYLARGDIEGFLLNLVTPATPLYDAGKGLAKAGYEAVAGKDVSSRDILAGKQQGNQWLRSIPVVGPLFYAWFGGGKEAYNEKLNKSSRSILEGD